ncbi:Y-family DNA polymerase [Falsiroseomonas sp. HW251]|uniref:Y-family DNA polymerase n=1 Tax=Falsiroseomonas sp. HW251 TaxID=3390998 RepID=UPI003D3211B9
MGVTPAASDRRHLALALPCLAVERLRRRGPVLVWHSIGPRREVVAVAGIAGIRPGQALSDAQAIAPDAEAIEADPAADAAFLERLALWAMRFSPLVAIAGTEALVLDITGAAHLFGGEAALLRRAEKGMARLGVTACGVTAGAPGTALALAHAGASGLVVLPGQEAEAVAPLGLSVLPVDPDIVATLARMGLRSIAEVRRQPRAPLARRFGAALLRALDEAAGEIAAPVSPIRPPPEFDATREFLEPLITREAIDLVVDGLLRVLCRKLEAAGRGARRVVLRAHRVDGAVQEVAISMGLAGRDPTHLARLFAEKLEKLEPGFGFDRITLGAEVTEPMTGTQGACLGGSGALQADELARLFDRLAQRVQVWRLAPAESHWPEREAMRVAATASIVVPQGWPRAPRPLRLLRRPIEIGAVAMVPDAPPSLLRLGRTAHRVLAAEGPERLEPEWWRERPDRPGRDYYRVELASGARLWVCRSGFGAAARWFIHGRL